MEQIAGGSSLGNFRLARMRHWQACGTLQLPTVCPHATFGRRPSIALVSRRWNQVLHATPSIWRYYELSASPLVLSPGRLWWSTEEQEGWLAAKLSQLRRISPAVEWLILGDTAGTDVMPEVLQCLADSQLTYISAFDYGVPLTTAAMRALAGLTRLHTIEFEWADHPLPANAGWALGRLTALRQLDLAFQWLPAELPAALARLPHLTSLTLCSVKALPAVQALTALRQLRLLYLMEEEASTGLTVLPVAHFPGATHLVFASPQLKASGRWIWCCNQRATLLMCLPSRAVPALTRLVPCSNALQVGAFDFTTTVAGRRCQAWVSCVNHLLLQHMALTESGSLATVVHALIPASQRAQFFGLEWCTLSPAAWQPGGELLSSVACLDVVECRHANGGHVPATLDSLLQFMPGLEISRFTNCDFSSGLPAGLRQLTGIQILHLDGARLLSLPALDCMPGVRFRSSAATVWNALLAPWPGAA